MPAHLHRPCRIVLVALLAAVVAMAAAPATPALARTHAKAATHAKRAAHPERAARPKRRPARTRTSTPRGAAAPATTSAPAPATATASPSPSLPVASGGCPDAQLIPSSQNLPRVASATLCLVNHERATAGLAALRPNAALTAAATSHSQDMVTGNYFAHVSPSGSAPLSRVIGYLLPGAGYSLGENIAAASGDLATPAATVNHWMNSPEHRTNILTTSYRDSGIGVTATLPPSIATGPGATYTQDFASTT